MLIIPWNANSGGFLTPTQAEKFTANGTFTASKAGYYRVLCVGGGGGGCGRCDTSVGGPGGGSGFVLTQLVQLAKDEAVTVTIGVGGAGKAQANGAIGSASEGGPTDFGNYLTAHGARGGLHYLASSSIIRGYGGAGGSGGGDHERGGGSDGSSSPADGGVGQGLGSFTDLVASFQSWSVAPGMAGSSPVNNGGGGGGIDVDADAVKASDGASAVGSGGSGYGAGGGGSASTDAGNGGAGANGLILVEGPVVNSV